jgi:uncharacterized protein YlxP (DUF503 family)
VVVGICRVQLRLDGNRSLKGKRAVLKPLLSRLHKEFNVAAAEIGDLDAWDLAEIGLAAIANGQAHVDQVLQNAVKWIEQSPLDVQLIDYQIEIVS